MVGIYYLILNGKICFYIHVFTFFHFSAFLLINWIFCVCCHIDVTFTCLLSLSNKHSKKVNTNYFLEATIKKDLKMCLIGHDTSSVQLLLNAKHTSALIVQENKCYSLPPLSFHLALTQTHTHTHSQPYQCQHNSQKHSIPPPPSQGRERPRSPENRHARRQVQLTHKHTQTEAMPMV